MALHEPTFDGNEVAYREGMPRERIGVVGGQVRRPLRGDAGGVHRNSARGRRRQRHRGAARLLLAAGVEPGDEVISPALTFIATTNAVAYCGATPHFVDVEARRWASIRQRSSRASRRSGDDATASPSTARPAGGSPRSSMHTFGHPADMDGMQRIARLRSPSVEDAAEAIGSTRDGVHVGGIGLCRRSASTATRS